VRIHLEKAIKANQIYLQEIATFIIKGSISTSYRLARKNAFIEIGNLMASFQRMTQEPKSKQKQLPQVYKLAVLNHHSLLSSLASELTSNHTKRQQPEAFNVVVDTAIKKLDNAILNENNAKLQENILMEDLEIRFTELKIEKELKQGITIDEEAFQLKKKLN
jgi:hypothetical protein